MALISFTPRVCRHSTLAASSTPTTALLLSASKKMKKWCCNIFICMLAEGKGFCLAKNKWKMKNVTCDDGFGEKAAWGPDVALGQVGRMFGQFLIFQGCSALRQILIYRSPFTSQFLIIISSSKSAQMLTCVFLNFLISQSDIINYQILKCCRVPNQFSVCLICPGTSQILVPPFA